MKLLKASLTWIAFIKTSVANKFGTTYMQIRRKFDRKTDKLQKYIKNISLLIFKNIFFICTFIFLVSVSYLHYFWLYTREIFFFCLLLSYTLFVPRLHIDADFSNPELQTCKLSQTVVLLVIVAASTILLAWESVAHVWTEISNGAVPEPEYAFYVTAILYSYLFTACSHMISLTNANTCFCYDVESRLYNLA